MRLLDLCFWRPTIIQFRDGNYALRMYDFRSKPFSFVFYDLKPNRRYEFTWSRDSKYFSDCLTPDLEVVLDRLAKMQAKKREIHQEKEDKKKKYTVICR